MNGKMSFNIENNIEVIQSIELIYENMTISKIEILANISLRVDELICSPDGKQLIFSTEPKSLNQEQMTDYELYSLDLTKPSPLIPLRLTNNLAIEENLKWSTDMVCSFLQLLVRDQLKVTMKIVKVDFIV